MTFLSLRMPYEKITRFYTTEVETERMPRMPIYTCISRRQKCARFCARFSITWFINSYNIRNSNYAVRIVYVCVK